VIRLSWGIVGKTEEEGGKFSFTNEIRFLVSIVAWRTTCFGIAWVASLIALALTSIAFFPVIEAAINTSK
jgi:hypothetical protein